LTSISIIRALHNSNHQFQSPSTEPHSARSPRTHRPRSVSRASTLLKNEAAIWPHKKLII
jgi:hypothetical protein